MKSEHSDALKMPYLREFGLRIDDIFRFEPMQGRGRELNLKRTKFMIALEDEHGVRVEGDRIILPHTESLGEMFELNLVWPEGESQELDGRYMLRSLKNIPFKIGQTYSYHAFISRGDEIILGHNKIVMFSGLDKSTYTSEVSLSDSLIKSSLNILIEGETGTGKSTLAKKIHEASGRAGRFVSVNLSSFSPSLIESELFGHVKGAFTGAINEKIGALIEANGGTLFIDEIDSLPIEVQTKLLLFLDTKNVRPVGASVEKKTNARLVFASGSKLITKVENGEMRKDFYFRLKMGESISLPALRDCPSKIRDYCEGYSNEHSVYISHSLVEFYCSLKWPGNIRELHGHLEKKRILSKSRRLEFDIYDEQLKHSGAYFKADLSGSFTDLETMKRSYSINVYHKFERDVKKASNVLKIAPATLRGWLRNESSYSERLSS